jgi:hypothetical protein
VTREQLEHLLRASATIVGDMAKTAPPHRLVVIGSQAILGQFPRAPAPFLHSMEVDLYPLDAPELADAIDGAIGEGSRFHDTYGIYVQGVGPRTAVLPRGWEGRLVRVESAATAPGVGLCLEVHDLAISKYVAGRPKDLEFNRELARNRLTSLDTLNGRLDATDVDAGLRRIVGRRIAAHFKGRAGI